MRTQSEKRMPAPCEESDIAKRALCESKEASDAGRQTFEKYREKLMAYDTDRLPESRDDERDDDEEEVPPGEKIPADGN